MTMNTIKSFVVLIRTS